MQEASQLKRVATASALKPAADHVLSVDAAAGQVRREHLWSWTGIGGRAFLLGVVAFLIAAVAGTYLMSMASPQVMAAARAFRLGVLYIAVSAAMIESNKWLMQKDRFPHPIVLTMNHMGVSCVLANLLRCACPSLFPALQHVQVSRGLILRFAFIGVPFAISLVCGNWAYRFCSVSFLQIMKQSNIVTIYVFALIAGLEYVRRCNVILLMVILTGAVSGVGGEVHFVLTGFLLQVFSSLSEATKVIMQSILMSGETKLDPLTMVLFMAPACLLANLVPFAIMERPQHDGIMDSFVQVWPYLLTNAVMAFMLNVVVAQCIKELSAVGYLLCGVVKDICIIVTSAWFLGESLSHMQVAGFSVSLVGICFYSIYKQNSAFFHDDNLVAGFSRLLSGDPKTNSVLELPPSPETCDGEKGK